MHNRVKEQVKVQVPGKLYIAGEYAVVSPYNPAIAFAVDAFIEIIAEKSNYKKIYDVSNSKTYDWHFDSEYQVIFQNDYWHNLELTAEAMTVTLHYISEKLELDLSEIGFNLEITNGLRSVRGKKYGFGSSGAATIATCQAILKLFSFDEELTHEEFALLNFKLATIAQSRLKKLGSFGDLAACSLGGLIYYQNFSRDILQKSNISSLENISTIVDSKWDGLEIAPVNVPNDWTISIVWSEKSSSTEKLIANDGVTLTAEQKNTFLANSKSQVQDVYESLQKEDWLKFADNLSKNAKEIKDYLELENRPYVLPAFVQAEEIAKSQGAIFKISGAGAGDCAIAISPTKEIANKVSQAWKDAGLTVLDHNIWHYPNTK